MGKYDPVRAWLQSQPESTQEMRVTFAELEAVLGAPLPPTARVDRPWWANTLHSPVGRSWVEAGWKTTRVDLKGQGVTFLRQNRGAAAVSREPRDYQPRGSYSRLTEFLSALPTEQEQLCLSLTEISQIMGRPLPNVAGRERTWWANTGSNPGAWAWVHGGWQVEAVYLAAGLVVFRRLGWKPVRDIPRIVASLLDAARKPVRLSAVDGAELIRFSRLAHWYFQGVTLYEKAGLALTDLSEAEQVAVEEDYSVCKRALTLYQRRASPTHVATRDENGQD